MPPRSVTSKSGPAIAQDQKGGRKAKSLLELAPHEIAGLDVERMRAVRQAQAKLEEIETEIAILKHRKKQAKADVAKAISDLMLHSLVREKVQLSLFAPASAFGAPR